MKSNFYVAGAAAMTSNKDNWETPQDLFDKLNVKYHFTLDPCSTDENAKCKKHFTVKENGLLQSWENEIVFCNPPYGRNIAEWVKKMLFRIETCKSYLINSCQNRYRIFS